jgi:hypothetical protein
MDEGVRFKEKGAGQSAKCKVQNEKSKMQSGKHKLDLSHGVAICE